MKQTQLQIRCIGATHRLNAINLHKHQHSPANDDANSRIMHIIMHSDQLYSTPREQTHSAQWVFNIFAIDIHKLPNIHTKIFFCGTHRNNVFAKCVWHQSERSPQWPVAVVVRRRLGRSWGGQCWSGLSPGYILTTLCPPGGPYIFVMCI